MATILLIDDDLSTLQMVSMIFEEKTDYRVVTASSGEEGLEKAFATPPDLVICDVMMPGLSGYQVCRRLRQEARTAQLPIIILTARAQAVDRQASLAAGANEYIAKPFDSQELIDRAESLLSRAADRPRAAQGQVITLFSLRGGVGVTSLAVNLAVALALQRQQPLALLDLNLTGGHVDLMLNLRPRLTWAELMSETTIDPDTLNRYLLSHPSGVRILAAPSLPTKAQTISIEKVEHTLALLKKQFDYILIDTPHAFYDKIFELALTNAYLALLIFTPEVASLRTTMNTLQALKSLNYAEEKLALILNHTFPKSGLDPKTVEGILKSPLDAVIPYGGDTLIQSITQGKPVILSRPDSAVATAIARLSSHINRRVLQALEKSSPAVNDLSDEVKRGAIEKFRNSQERGRE